MKYILVSILFFAQAVVAQELSEQDKRSIASIKSTVEYLSDDKLEGRRTGTAGEKLAYEFIASQFKKHQVQPMGDGGSYVQSFDVNDGKEIQAGNTLRFADVNLSVNEDYFPLPYAPIGSATSAVATYYLLDLNQYRDSGKSNPHFDQKEAILNKIKEEQYKGTTAFLICNTAPTGDPEKFDEKDKTASVGMPVFYLTASGLQKYKAAENKRTALSYSIKLSPKIRKGHNVIGYIDNKAASTIILGAHYDHLGYGEDHNSLYAGTTPMVHNGADDNASGTAALIELSDRIGKSGLKKYNYIFIAFSGEELGLYGSKYFTEHSPIGFDKVNFMINMDMVGRLNDSTHGLTIGGYGTSPAWSDIIKTGNEFFKIKLDSSGSGPSDHTSFYRKDVPVLFFFTGTHTDYHKPSDDANKINYKGELDIIKYIYRVIEWANEKDKLAFTKTKESTTSAKSSFKVTLGIMIDYTFSDNGVLVEGVSENRPAQKAGIKVGDILYQIGAHPFSDVQTYMQTLNKFNKGDATKVKLRRGKEEVELDLVF